MRVVVTGGGTGGHAYPALSIAHAIRSRFPESEILYLGSKSGIESDLADSAGIPFVGLTSRKVKKLFSPDTVLTIGYMAKGLAEAGAELRQFGADIVIGTGGYVAAAVVLSQAMRGGKTIILEPDVIPGRTNALLSRLATKVCVAFEEAVDNFPHGHVVVTGMPVHSDLKNLPDKRTARAKWGLKLDPFTVLVLGGSQGARTLNECMVDSIPRMRELPVQVIHQSGSRHYDAMLKRAEGLEWDGFHAFPYIDDMASAYASADLVICRSGSSTVAEVTAVGLPSVLVPYPYAHANHQQYNAEVIVKAGAAEMILDRDLNADRIIEILTRMVGSRDCLEVMAESSRKLGKIDAADTIADLAAGLI